jgi:hypothetical protein
MQRSVIQSRVRKSQNGRLAQGRQRSVIPGSVTRYRTAGVRAGRMVKTGKTRKQGLEQKQEYGKNAGRRDETRQTGNRQTENTGINTQGIMGQMGDTWRGVDTSTKQVKQIRV